MGDLFLLSERQMARISPFFPLSHGVPRVDDRRVVSGIIYVIRNGLQWKDAPAGYGPHKTLYNRFIRWRLMGVFSPDLRLGPMRRGRSPCAAGSPPTRLKAFSRVGGEPAALGDVPRRRPGEPIRSG